MEPFVHAIEEIFKLIWEMLSAVLGVIPTVLKFLLWVFLAILILPCVWIAGHVYPWWVDLGEEF